MYRQLKVLASPRTITRWKKWDLKSQANLSRGSQKRVPRTFHLLTFQCSSLLGRPYFSPTESPITNAKMPSNTTTTTMIIINFWRGIRETKTRHYYTQPKAIIIHLKPNPSHLNIKSILAIQIKKPTAYMKTFH